MQTYFPTRGAEQENVLLILRLKIKTFLGLAPCSHHVVAVHLAKCEQMYHMVVILVKEGVASYSYQAPGVKEHLTGCVTRGHLVLVSCVVCVCVRLTVDNKLRVFVEFIKTQSFFQLQLRRHGAGVTWKQRRRRASFPTSTHLLTRNQVSGRNQAKDVGTIFICLRGLIIDSIND